ncbi:MAG: CDP-alcohol phosphatidyltransferase family protein [Candidatus Binatus sp.]|uniref:CDP-alcohol phosphatidyltransferase family protein n=1 Tax=Candidatus Binatus sp. TaxID=2811406 RepID=UPI00271E1197|nr:CDP-alcohol phosphatidyltransferase family protein [Candidatus Binatus sp.]MDO8432659.1 CDP-alcohol phosphatidyltransferase family protein [Candidatus Binatus sp.]
MRSQIPNGLSALRFALAAIWVELAANGHTGRAAYVIIAIVAAGSDFIDGRIARRLGVASDRGRWLDGVADVTFILAALWCEAVAGAIERYIPILIAISFSQYALDSIVIARASAGPIKSRLGHWGGIVNYAIVIALAFSPPRAMIAAAVRAMSPLVAIFYIAAIVERAWLFYRS